MQRRPIALAARSLFAGAVAGGGAGSVIRCEGVRPDRCVAPSGPRRRITLAFAIALCLSGGLLAGCTTNSPSDPTANPTSTPTDPVTPVSIVPVTPDGLSTGRGVTDDDITLGLLVDADRDRGFGRGVEFWQTSVNNAGGICGRRIELLGNGRGGLPDKPVDAYDTVALNSLGLITLAGRDQEAALNGRVSADQIPTLTSEGTAEQLGPDRPIIVGATDDVLVINVLDMLRLSGQFADGDSIGVLSDDSPSARNAVQGASGGPSGVGSPSTSARCRPTAAPRGRPRSTTR